MQRSIHSLCSISDWDINGVSKSTDPDYILNSSLSGNNLLVTNVGGDDIYAIDGDFASPFTGYTFMTSSAGASYRLNGGQWTSLPTGYVWKRIELEGVYKIEVTDDSEEPDWNPWSYLQMMTKQLLFTNISDAQAKDIDTLLDTPMNNYAVLETGVNGNLTGSGTSTSVTYKGESGVTYYFEEIKEDGTMVERRRYYV